MSTFKDWLAYKKAYVLAMEIFEISKLFPPEERYSLTDQVRRSSRSVCANLAEAFRRKRYRPYFLSKLNDSETENAETDVFLDFAMVCNYISAEKHKELTGINDEVGKLVWYMINNPEKFM